MKARTISPDHTVSLAKGGVVTHEFSEQPELARPELERHVALGTVEMDEGKVEKSKGLDAENTKHRDSMAAITASGKTGADRLADVQRENARHDTALADLAKADAAAKAEADAAAKRDADTKAAADPKKKP